jgi:hypothetical protein
MPAYSIRSYTPADYTDWEQFVRSSNNGTLFHRQDFLSYHTPNKFTFRHLMVYGGNTLMAVIPGGEVIDQIHGTKKFWSPMGASYGGIVSADLSYQTAQDIVDAFVEYGYLQGWSDCYLIPPPFMYQTHQQQHIEYAMLFRRFTHELHYISHAIDVRTWQLQGDQFVEHFDKTARKSVRKTLKTDGLRIEQSTGSMADYRAFHHILQENKKKHNATPTHSLDDLLRLQDLVPESLQLLMVYLHDTPIAGSLLFACNPHVLLCFYNMLLYEYQEYKPVYLIMYETVRRAIEGGFRYVDIGVSQVPADPNPMTPALDLITYKERFNAKGFLRSTYHFRF